MSKPETNFVSAIGLLFDRYGHARRGKKHDAVERAIHDPRQPPPDKTNPKSEGASDAK